MGGIVARLAKLERDRPEPGQRLRAVFVHPDTGKLYNRNPWASDRIEVTELGGLRVLRVTYRKDWRGAGQ